MKPIKDVFTDIYHRRGFGGMESFSGEGSDVLRTTHLREELGRLFQSLGIKTLLDIPCGDFNWMRKVDLTGIRCTGADVVEELVRGNSKLYTGLLGVDFQVLDITTDNLPQVDLILCRDCLVHFSFENVFKALENVCWSGSVFLLTTTFPATHKNVDIITGKWRTLNLEIPPFNLPPPMLLVNEQCPVVDTDGSTYPDKSLGLWRIEDVRRSLDRRTRPLGGKRENHLE